MTIITIVKKKNIYIYMYITTQIKYIQFSYLGILITNSNFYKTSAKREKKWLSLITKVQNQ